MCGQHVSLHKLIIGFSTHAAHPPMLAPQVHQQLTWGYDALAWSAHNPKPAIIHVEE